MRLILPSDLQSEEEGSRFRRVRVDCRSLPNVCVNVQANLDESQMSSGPFLRALMTAVCKAAVKGER